MITVNIVKFVLYTFDVPHMNFYLLQNVEKKKKKKLSLAGQPFGSYMPQNNVICKSPLQNYVKFSSRINRRFFRATCKFIAGSIAIGSASDTHKPATS